MASVFRGPDQTPPPTHPCPAHSISRCRTARALGFQVERGVRSVFLRKTDLTPEAIRLLLLLFFLQSGVDAHGNCPWPGGWAAQGREPHGCGDRATWTYLQRPLRSLPSRPTLASQALFATHPEGLRRWLDNQIPRKQKRPSTGPGRSRNSGRAGVRTPASLRRPARWPSGDHPPCGGPAGQPGTGQPVQRRAAPGR